MNERYARRTVLFICAAAVVVQAAAARPVATAPTSSDCPPFASGVLRLYVINEGSASSQTLDTAILETGAIWATAGLHLTWASPPAPLEFAGARTVIVMIQRGLKRPPPIAGPSDISAAPLLGRVAFGEDGPGNLIQVSFDAITSTVMGGSYLDTPVAKLPDFVQQVLLGRGLGRVVAHELGHWLGGRGHMPDGLMRPVFGERDLVEVNAPRLPRAWTSAGAGAPPNPSSHCESALLVPGPSASPRTAVGGSRGWPIGFEDFTLDPDTQLRLNGDEIHLLPKAFDLLTGLG